MALSAGFPPQKLCTRTSSSGTQPFGFITKAPDCTSFQGEEQYFQQVKDRAQSRFLNERIELKRPDKMSVEELYHEAN